MMQDDSKLKNRIRNMLDASLEDLDPDVCRRLQQARHTALETSTKAHMPFWQPAGALLLVSVMLLIIFIWPERQNLPEPVTLADVELMTADDSLQLYEDLDFYQWLLENDSNAG